ncbi:MAG: UDP-N-acetylmuramate--L-alanine ligase [Ornithinimicrobium sp.]|uniref:UDP-N-acetylmuramate--L-alanine ligase n=1 Tax=Ornithinimicrobium sp. TaxID=1977084 RepID=UPI003D9BEEA3
MSAERFNFAAAVPPVADLGVVHLIAVGGSGMSGVARMLLAAGCVVSGSDQQPSSTLRELAAEGAQVHLGHDAAHVGGADTVIVSGAVRETNPELAAARSRGLRVLHRAQGIAALLGGRDAVAVAGANGKTTTAAMLTHLLKGCGADPGYVLGSALLGGSNAALGTGPVVVEADESDGSFLAYRPRVAVVTNITADHLDFYGDLAGVRRAFRRFADTVGAGAPDGLLVTSADDPGTKALTRELRELGRPVLTWGSSADADLVLDQVETGAASGSTVLRCTRGLGPVKAGSEHRLEIPMPGRHNLHNAVAALLAATAGLGQSIDTTVQSLATFPGTRRRFERLGVAAGVEVVDDYAHNPDKVAAVVLAGRSAVRGAGRLIVVFQPHLYSRTRAFAEQFAAGLSGADVVVLLDVYGAREEPVPGVDSELIAQHLRAGRSSVAEVRVGNDPDSAPGELAALVRPGDLVLTVGAGDVTKVGPRLLLALGRSPNTTEETH